MTRRLWWRVEEILPLAEHAAATPQHLRTRQQIRAAFPDLPALIWTRDADGDWMSSNGTPRWYNADGTHHRVRAETWTHTATGTTGNPLQADEGQGFLPLHAEHLDGRRTLLDLLRFAREHDVHWFGLHPDRASDETNDRYLLSLSRDDLVPPEATWTPANVTSETVGGGTYRAMVADGYTALDGGVLARFPRGAVERMAENLRTLSAGDMPGEHPTLRLLDGAEEICDNVEWAIREALDFAIVEWEADDDEGIRAIERDRVLPDANGCYAIGAYQWCWTMPPAGQAQR